jgi:hypothetical protein
MKYSVLSTDLLGPKDLIDALSGEMPGCPSILVASLSSTSFGLIDYFLMRLSRLMGAGGGLDGSRHGAGIGDAGHARSNLLARQHRTE